MRQWIRKYSSYWKIGTRKMCMKWLLIIRHVNSVEQCRTVSTVSKVSTVSTVSTVIARCYLHLWWYFYHVSKSNRIKIWGEIGCWGGSNSSSLAPMQLAGRAWLLRDGPWKSRQQKDLEFLPRLEWTAAKKGKCWRNWFVTIYSTVSRDTPTKTTKYFGQNHFCRKHIKRKTGSGFLI